MDSFDRPRAIGIFLGLWLLVLALSILNLLILGKYLDGTDAVIQIGALALQIALMWACAARHNWARWVLAILYALGVISMLIGIGVVFQVSIVAGASNLLSLVAGGIGVGVLFGREASEWYQTRPRRERTEAEAAARHRRLKLGLGGVVAVAAVVIGTIVAIPHLTDWAPYLERCMTDGDDPEQAAAIEACTEIIESSPFGGAELAEVMVRRGHLALANGDRHDAIQDFWHATEEDPDSVEAWRSRAEVRLQMEHGHLVLQYVERALALAPGDPGLIAMRGHGYLLEDRNAEGLADLEQAVADGIDTARTYTVLGVARTRMGDPEGALDAFAAALEHDDADAGTWVLQAEALIEAGQAEQALTSYQRAIELMPGAADAHLGVVVAHCALGDFTSAHARIQTMQQSWLLTVAGWKAVMMELGYLAEEDADAVEGALDMALDAWMADGCPLPVPGRDDA